MQIKFKKIKTNGELATGILEFESLKEAELKILEPGELLLELESLKKAPRYRLNSQDVLDFTIQMHQLISAGLPVYESLLSLREKKLKIDGLIQDLAEGIKKGHSFSSIIKNHPDVFSPIYVAIIQASEAAGELKDGFASLKILLEKQLKIKKTLKNALNPLFFSIFDL